MSENQSTESSSGDYTESVEHQPKGIPPTQRGKGFPGSAGSGEGNTKRIVLSVIVALLVVGGAFAAVQIFSDRATLDESAVVATVNGEEITRGELNAFVDQSLAAQGAEDLSPRSPERQQLEGQALEQMISVRLVLQEARRLGITADEQAVDEQVAQIAAQFGGAEGFQQQLDEFGITEEGLRADIRDQVLLDQYVLAISDDQNITITEEEIRAFYDQVAAGQEDIPPFEEVRDQIEEQLRQEQLNTIIASVVEELREGAEIEILL